ncbi:MAG: hypothetical protein COA78_28595 [Blastopirellula sp.]|nr:MAG: hypothetical protein COA78_28595 [Blastopirellula sp.]
MTKQNNQIKKSRSHWPALTLCLGLAISALFLIAFSAALQSEPYTPDPPAEEPEPAPEEPGSPEKQKTIKYPKAVRERLKLRTPVQDEVLHGLEKDFVELLQESKHAQALLEAEELLEATNDNTHWTNYKAATKILREHRDIAAIPLLLRYIAVHAERSSAHVMIPEYAKTISIISGHKIESPYKGGPNLEGRMHNAVQELVTHWWSKQRDTLIVDPDKMSDDQLRTIVDTHLNQIKQGGYFRGSGGAIDSAYRAYHNMYYLALHTSSSDRFKIPVLHPKLITMVLQRIGYSETPTAEESSKKQAFPFECIPILAALAENGHRTPIEKIAADTRQNSAVRLVCIFSLFRSGGELLVDDILEINEHETQLQPKMLCLLALRYGGDKAIPVLLKHMDDPNFEIATAAACALQDAQPLEALPKFKRLIWTKTARGQAAVMLFSTLSGYKHDRAKQLLVDYLTEALEEGSGGRSIDRALSAFETISGQRFGNYREQSEEERTRLALAWYQEYLAKVKAQMTKLIAQLENAETQLVTAQGIAKLRQSEYKRLLGLQAEEIITAEQSSKAYQHLQSARAEVTEQQVQVTQLKAKLETMKKQTN